MKIQTLFETGDTVWFYDMGEINKAKIIHVEINLNGGEKIEYTLDRKDKTYKKYHDYVFYRYRLCSHESEPAYRFLEEDLAETKDELIAILKIKENNRHNKRMEEISSL